MRMVLIVGDNVGCSVQSSGLPNEETCTKISRSEMSRMWTHLLSLWALLNNTLVNIDLNKPWIISNSGELSDLEHLPTKTEYIKYLHIASTCTSHLFWPIKQHYIRFK